MPGIWGNSFQALDATTVYVLGSDGKLWRETGDLNNRSQVDANVGLFSALDATTVYVLGTDRKLWRETGDLNNRTLVDSNVAAFQALDTTTVYVIGTDGNLWRESGTSANRVWVDGNVDKVQALDATTVYVRSRDFSLWRETGDMRTRTWVDGNVYQFKALDTSMVYVVGGNGTLWREVGTMSDRTEVDANLMGFTPQKPGNQPSSFAAHLNLTFSDSTPVGGWTNLQLNKDGSYVFSGHLHDSGFVGFKVGIAWAVRDNTGKVYTFGASGSVQGTFDAPFGPNRDWDFNLNGTNAALVAAWPNLPPPGQAWQCEVTASLDLAALITEVVNDVQTIFKVVTAVIAIVG
jgi:hypothetical protein